MQSRSTTCFYNQNNMLYIADNGKEILSMNEVLLYLIRNCKPLLDEEDLPALVKLSKHEWQDFVDQIRGMIVTYPGMVYTLFDATKLKSLNH